MRQALALVASKVLPAWRSSAAEGAKLRSRQHIFVQRIASRRLHSWRDFVLRTKSRRRSCRRGAELQDRATAQRRRRTFRAMLAAVHTLRWRRNRLTTVVKRGEVSLYQRVWSAWLRLLRLAVLQRREDLEREVAVAAARVGERRSELEKAMADAGDSELRRLRLVDELCEAAARTASLYVEGQEAERMTDSLQQALEEEQAAERLLQNEAAALRSELAGAEVRCASRRQLLEEELSWALQTPTALRQALRDCEAEAAQASLEESEAAHEANMLQNELQELNLHATQRLREKELEVSSLHEQVGCGHRTVQELEEVLMQRQLALHSQEVHLEEMRMEDTSRYLDMVSQI